MHHRMCFTHGMLVEIPRSQVSPDVAKCLLGDTAPQLGAAGVQHERKDQRPGLVRGSATGHKPGLLGPRGLPCGFQLRTDMIWHSFGKDCSRRSVGGRGEESRSQSRGAARRLLPGAGRTQGAGPGGEQRRRRAASWMYSGGSCRRIPAPCERKRKVKGDSVL